MADDKDIMHFTKIPGTTVFVSEKPAIKRDWRDVPITAGMLVKILENHITEELLVDFNMAGLIDPIATDIEETAKEIADPNYKRID